MWSDPSTQISASHRNTEVCSSNSRTGSIVHSAFFLSIDGREKIRCKQSRLQTGSVGYRLHLWMQQREGLSWYSVPKSTDIRVRPRVAWMELITDAHAWSVTDVNSSNEHAELFFFINSHVCFLSLSPVRRSCCSFFFISCLSLCLSLYPALWPNSLSLPPSCQVAGSGYVELHSWQRLSELTQRRHCVQTSRTHSRGKKKNLKTQPPFCLSARDGAELIRLH